MKKKYILLLLIIIVGVFIMTSIGIIYKKVDNSKENKSYISNKVNNYEYKDIESGMNEIKDNGYLYLTYIGSKNIYNLEKYIYKTLKNNKLSDKFIYINCTDNINDKKIINDLNDKLSIITDNEIVLPAIIYYKNEKPVDYIDSTNQILTGDKFVQLMDKWEVNK